MFEEGAEGFSFLPYYLLVIFPTLLILSPSVVTANPQSNFPLTVSRMSQFDLYGNFYGKEPSFNAPVWELKESFIENIQVAGRLH